MRRPMTLALLSGLLVASISVPWATSVSALSQSNAAPAKKVCTTKKVHGKKKRVCHQVKPKPTPTPTPVLSFVQQVDNLLTSKNYSGSILLERHGQILLEKSYGMADRSTNTPNTPQTKFPIFGINYQMAAVGIMKLQEGGKLSVGDKLCSYLAGCPAAWQPITLEEILTSTSGIADYDWGSSTGGTETTLAGCESQPMAEVPGTQLVDSDCHSFLLNTVIEKASGKSWSDFMQETIFGPAGMTDSGRMTNSLEPPQRARGYTRSGLGPKLNYDAIYMAYSTLEDVYRYTTALLAGKIVSQRSLDQLFAARLVDPPPALNGDVVYRGYAVGVFKASSTMVGQIFAAGGDETWGFGITDFMSPDDGTVGINFINDTGAFTGDDENRFWDLLVRPGLFGK
jgi:CubicO group peptidase (beta-lactamase class C family)